MGLRVNKRFGLGGAFIANLARSGLSVSKRRVSARRDRVANQFVSARQRRASPAE